MCSSDLVAGMIASLGWILCSSEAFTQVYGLPADRALVPFSQPGIVSIPFSFLTLVVVSWMTRRSEDMAVDQTRSNPSRG